MSIVYQVILVLVPLILSLSVHEFAHAWSAHRLGDDTAKRMGRMTLNPLAHIDLLGTLILPILLTVRGGGFFFAWAKPVPVNPSNFRRGITMRQGHILTSVAGPMSNVIIAFISSGMYLGASYYALISQSHPVMVLLAIMFRANISLAVFNMLPVPPLDGHSLLPEAVKEKIRPYQMFIFVGLILAINLLSDIMAVPIIFLGHAMESFWGLIFGGIL